MEVLRVPMSGDDRDYVQFLHFEKESYKEILSYILLEKHKGYEYSIKNYEHFMNEFKEASIKFNIAFNEMLLTYAPEYHGNDNYIAHFDFESCEFVIKQKEGEQI